MEDKFIAQLKRCELYFKENTASRFMASVETGIAIQNICRYCDMLMRSGNMALVRYDVCRISGEVVQFLSCDENKFPKDYQLKFPFWNESTQTD